MDGIVTRNPADYQGAKVKAWRPEELLPWLIMKNLQIHIIYDSIEPLNKKIID